MECGDEANRSTQYCSTLFLRLNALHAFARITPSCRDLSESYFNGSLPDGLFHLANLHVL